MTALTMIESMTQDPEYAAAVRGATWATAYTLIERARGRLLEIECQGLAAGISVDPVTEDTFSLLMQTIVRANPGSRPDLSQTKSHLRSGALTGSAFFSTRAMPDTMMLSGWTIVFGIGDPDAPGEAAIIVMVDGSVITYLDPKDAPGSRVTSTHPISIDGDQVPVETNLLAAYEQSPMYQELVSVLAEIPGQELAWIK